MTWTWRDDDPATAASAENFNTHIEMRLRSLEVAGGGGGGSTEPTDVLVFGTDVELLGDWASADPTNDGSAKARLYKQGGRVYLTGVLIADGTVGVTAAIPAAYRPSQFGDTDPYGGFQWEFPIVLDSGALAKITLALPNSHVVTDDAWQLGARLSETNGALASGEYLYIDAISWPLAT